MRIAEKALTAAFLLALILANPANAATAPSSSSDSYTIVVETAGTVPGFTQGQLAAYLARRMHEETAAPWQFAAGPSGAAPAPNRLVWSFKTLRVLWKSGSHRGFPSPDIADSYLSVEVKLFLKDNYQLEMIVHPSVSGGPDDVVLAQMVHDVAHALFVENKPEMP